MSKWLWACVLGAEIACACAGAIGCGGAAAPSAALTVGRSCVGTPDDACRGASCCARLAVPTQSFTLGGAVERPTSAATVSAFSLETLEVTVGRFRRFVGAYDAWRAAGNPRAGDGAHPLIPGSGWQSAWSSSLPVKAGELIGAAGVVCGDGATFNAQDPTYPMNCVSWYEAFAFCVFDGGRLPTEAEWESAAAGGAEERPFPWGAAPPDPTLAVYDCVGDGSAPGECSVADLLPVGARPAGAGRWGHQDLAGSVWEWALDWYAAYPEITNDFADITTGNYRVIRGSGWNSEADALRVPIRYSVAPAARRPEFGFRCAAAD